jgi:hypothetical protein
MQKAQIFNCFQHLNCRLVARAARLAITVCLSLTGLAPSAFADTAVFDFRGRPFEGDHFRLTGSNAHKVMQSDAQGLRIAIPANHVNRLPVGLVWGHGIRGDFEITLDFEFLDADKPSTGYGAGVSIYITMVSPGKEAATLGRFRHASGDVLMAHRASTGDDGRRQHRTQTFPKKATSGKLRLARTGTLSYQFAEGKNDFQEILQDDIGDGDVDQVRFAADTGGAPALVDVRIPSLSLHADSFEEARALPPPTHWLFWLIAGIIVFLLLSAGVWLWAQRGLGILQRAK